MSSKAGYLPSGPSSLHRCCCDKTQPHLHKERQPPAHSGAGDPGLLRMDWSLKMMEIQRVFLEQIYSQSKVNAVNWSFFKPIILLKISEEHYLEISRYYDHEIKYKSSFSTTNLFFPIQIRTPPPPKFPKSFLWIYRVFISFNTSPHPQPTHAVRFRRPGLAIYNKIFKITRHLILKTSPPPKGKSLPPTRGFAKERKKYVQPSQNYFKSDEELQELSPVQKFRDSSNSP